MTADRRFDPDDLGALVRHILLHEALRPVAQVAAALRLTPTKFQSRMRGGARFSPEELAILLHEIPDERLARWLLSDSSLLLVLRPSRPRPDQPAGALLPRAAAAATEGIAALRALADALGGSGASGRHIAATRRHADRAQAELLWIRQHVAAASPDRAPLPNGEPADGFAHRVSQVLLTGKGVALRDLADALGLRYHALHARVTGRVAFTPNEIRRLLQQYPEPGLADYLLARTPYIAMPRPVPTDPQPVDTPLQVGLLALQEMVSLLGALAQSTDTTGCDVLPTVRQSVEAALRQLARLDWDLTHIGRPPSHD